MTKATFERVYSPPPHSATSPFPILPAASTRLSQATSFRIEVPGTLIGAIGYEGWGYGLGSVSEQLSDGVYAVGSRLISLPSLFHSNVKGGVW